MNLFKKTTASILGVLFAFLPSSQVKADDVAVPVPENQPARAKFTKDELISALKALDRNVATVQVVSAMCYDMAVAPEDIQYHCSVCGKDVTYKRILNEGYLAEQVANIQRSLGQLPYKTSVDSVGLCSVCGKDKPRVLVVHVACLECGQDVAWEIKDANDVSLLQWLYMPPPFNEIDGHYLGIWSHDKESDEKIRAGVVYIRDHVFCPLHRGQVNLERDVQK